MSWYPLEESELKVLTQGNYGISAKYTSTKSKIKCMVSKEEWKVVEKFETSMIIGSLSESRRVRILDSVLALSKLLDGKSWLELDRNSIELLVAKVMTKYSKNGQETNTTSDHKKSLKQWFRFLRLGIRLHKQAEKEFGFGKKLIPINDFSRKTLAAIRKFQHGYCVVNGCNVTKLLEKYHIRGRDDNSAENCQLLYPFHHREKTNRDRIRKQIAKRLEKE